MKFIRRRYEGDIHTDAFILWQRGNKLFRLFINIGIYQICFGIFNRKTELFIRKPNK